MKNFINYFRTFTIRRMRRGLEAARYDYSDDLIYLWFSPFGKAYVRERRTLAIMQAAMSQKVKRQYQGLVLSGMLGFANESTRLEILRIEGEMRREATAFLRGRTVDSSDSGE